MSHEKASPLSYRSLGILAVAASILLLACAIVLEVRSGSRIADCDDYAPTERVLNGFDAHEMWGLLVVSPEGDLLVSAGFRKLTWVTHWDDSRRTAAVVQDLDFGERVVAAASSGDGRRIAFLATSPAQDVIAVFDARTRELLYKWPAARSIYSPMLRLSHDGSLLVMNTVERVNRADHLEAVTVWETSTGKLVSSLRTPKGLYLTDFVPTQGRMLLAYLDQPDYKEISIYESVPPCAQTAPVSSIEAPGAVRFGSARFSTDGTQLAVASSHAQPMKIYAVSEGRLIAEFDKAHYGVSSDNFPGFVFSSSGKLLAVSNSGGTVSLWSVGSAKELCTLKGRRTDPIGNLVFGPDGGTLISFDPYRVVVWDIRDLVDHDD
jgi:WD40 repeat protein